MVICQIYDEIGCSLEESIGKETAVRFVAEGAKVVINGRDRSKLEAAALEIDPTGNNILVSVRDIALPETGTALVDATLSRFGKLDVLVNNAGVFNPKPLPGTYRSGL